MENSNVENASVSSRESIISHMSEISSKVTPGRDFIRSTEMSDILYGSPNVVIVEIGAACRLLHQQINKDWMETDLYYVTVVRSIKGDFNYDDEMVVTFFANTVSPGERHIIAVLINRAGWTW